MGARHQRLNQFHRINAQCSSISFHDPLLGKQWKAGCVGADAVGICLPTFCIQMMDPRHGDRVTLCISKRRRRGVGESCRQPHEFGKVSGLLGRQCVRRIRQRECPGISTMMGAAAVYAHQCFGAKAEKMLLQAMELLNTEVLARDRQWIRRASRLEVAIENPPDVGSGFAEELSPRLERRRAGHIDPNIWLRG
jgi:hypothetical protein